MEQINSNFIAHAYARNRSGNLFVIDELLDLHSKIEGCALCQTDVPCESEIPVIKVINE